MIPNKKRIINGHKIEEYYWAGVYPIYVDHKLVDETFKEACDRLLTEGEEKEPGQNVPVNVRKEEKPHGFCAGAGHF